VTDHREPEERQVADGVEHLVARELVGEAQPLRIEDGELVDHDGVLQASAPGQAGLLHALDVAQEAEGAGARDFPLVAAVGEGEAKGLVGDQRVLEVDRELDGGRVGRLEPRQLVAVAHLDRPRHDDEPLADALLGDARLPDERHEGSRGAVEDGDLAPVHLDAAVVDPHAGEGGEHVLDCVDAGRPEDQVGGQGGVRDVRGQGRDLGSQVHPDEANAAVGRRRRKGELRGSAGVQSDPRAGHALPNGSLVPVRHVESPPMPTPPVEPHCANAQRFGTEQRRCPWLCPSVRGQQTTYG
jgi:hypothetical protein